MDSTVLQSVIIPHDDDMLALLRLRKSLREECGFIPAYPLWGMLRGTPPQMQGDGQMRCTLGNPRVSGGRLMLPGTLSADGTARPFTLTLGIRAEHGTPLRAKTPLDELRIFRIARVRQEGPCWTILRQRWIKTK